LRKFVGPLQYFEGKKNLQLTNTSLGGFVPSDSIDESAKLLEDISTPGTPGLFQILGDAKIFV